LTIQPNLVASQVASTESNVTMFFVQLFLDGSSYESKMSKETTEAWVEIKNKTFEIKLEALSNNSVLRVSNILVSMNLYSRISQLQLASINFLGPKCRCQKIVLQSIEMLSVCLVFEAATQYSKAPLSQSAPAVIG